MESDGDVISPILFALYIHDLLYELELSGVACFWDDQFVGALAYADDLGSSQSCCSQEIVVYL